MESEPQARKRNWFSYSLRSLMLLVLLIAVYLGGRYGAQPAPPDTSVSGTWQAEMPAGFVRPVTLKHLEANRFVFSSGASVFNGVYTWEGGLLTVAEPSDDRMAGLTWRWKDGELLLIGEPGNTPTGSSYLGTTLKRVPPAKQ